MNEFKNSTQAIFQLNLFLIYGVLSKNQAQLDKVKHNFKWLINDTFFPVKFY